MKSFVLIHFASVDSNEVRAKVRVCSTLYGAIGVALFNTDRTRDREGRGARRLFSTEALQKRKRLRRKPQPKFFQGRLYESWKYLVNGILGGNGPLAVTPGGW
jgi:hypothetical protein